MTDNTTENVQPCGPCARGQHGACDRNPIVLCGCAHATDREAFRDELDDHIAESMKDPEYAAAFDADRYTSLVENNLLLGRAIDLALEATYWDRPYDTRLDAIREYLHEARGERYTRRAEPSTNTKEKNDDRDH